MLFSVSSIVSFGDLVVSLLELQEHNVKIEIKIKNKQIVIRFLDIMFYLKLIY